MIVSITSLAASNAEIMVNPLGSYAGIVFVEYGVVVITRNSSHLELLSVTQKASNLTPYDQFGKFFSVNSSKFVFGYRTHNVNPFIQWISTKNNACGTG